MGKPLQKSGAVNGLRWPARSYSITFDRTERAKTGQVGWRRRDGSYQTRGRGACRHGSGPADDDVVDSRADRRHRGEAGAGARMRGPLRGRGGGTTAPKRPASRRFRGGLRIGARPSSPRSAAPVTALKRAARERAPTFVRSTWLSFGLFTGSELGTLPEERASFAERERVPPHAARRSRAAAGNSRD